MKTFDIFAEVFYVVVNIKPVASEKVLKFKLGDTENSASFAEADFLTLKKEQNQFLQQFSFGETGSSD